jgi:hypothetical protein
MHRLKILDHTGHSVLTWDPEVADQVDTTRERFERLMRQNFVAFDLSHSPGELIHEFRSEASEIVVTPQFAGG